MLSFSARPEDITLSQSRQESQEIQDFDLDLASFERAMELQVPNGNGMELIPPSPILSTISPQMEREVSMAMQIEEEPKAFF